MFCFFHQKQKVNECNFDSITLEIEPFATLPSPYRIKRSKMFSLSTSTYFVCNLTFNQSYKWTGNRLSLSGYSLIDLNANPSSFSSELVIQKNQFDYGIYEFTFEVEINGFRCNISTFIEIIPSGLAVYALENGIQSVTIGYEQSLTLDAPSFSFDFDNLVSSSNLTFKYYCSPNEFNTDQIDLASYKQNSSLIMAPNQTCFSSNGNFN